ncbi:MAG: hypothetical protein KAS32_30005 [Candidatus Peribacteraceae bacterium]|nr:hypothetical protein [Candidatus Peribacteraceae bacterium]
MYVSERFIDYWRRPDKAPRDNPKEKITLKNKGEVSREEEDWTVTSMNTNVTSQGIARKSL